MKLGSQNSAVNVVQHRCKCFVVICKITAGKTPFVAIRPHLMRLETPSLVDVVCRNDESKKSKPWRKWYQVLLSRRVQREPRRSCVGKPGVYRKFVQISRLPKEVMARVA